MPAQLIVSLMKMQPPLSVLIDEGLTLMDKHLNKQQEMVVPTDQLTGGLTI